MPSLHVRDVPEDALRALKTRAAESGQSLQGHVRLLLVRHAQQLTAEEAMRRAAEIASRNNVTQSDVLEALHEARNERAR